MYICEVAVDPRGLRLCLCELRLREVELCAEGGQFYAVGLVGRGHLDDVLLKVGQAAVAGIQFGRARG